MEETLNRLKRRTAICVTTLTAAGLSFGVVACGGSDTASGTASATETTTSTTAGAPAGVGGPFADLTDTQIQCLEDEGVTVPTAGEGGGMPGGTTGDQGAAPAGMPDGGTPPAGGPGGDMEVMQAAAQACGIDLPEPPSGGMPEGDPAAAAS